MSKQKQFDIQEVKEFISNSSPQSKIYIGADSERYKNHGIWYAKYTVAIVIHRDGCKGGKVFADFSVERDFDPRKDKPRMRLMAEVMKAASMYLELADAIGERHFEVHLDVNPNEEHGSSCIIKEAIGYIRGMCGVTPKVKPDAFCASYCADRGSEIMFFRDHPHVVSASAAARHGDYGKRQRSIKTVLH